MFTITGIRHAWPEQAGFCLNRQNGHPDYSFVHFINKVEIRLHGETNVTSDHACIIYRPETPQHIVSHRPLVHDWFHFSGIPEPLLEQLELPLDTLFYPQNYQFITPLVQEMEREFFAHHVGSRELISARIVELFVLLSRASHSDSVLTTDDSTLERLRSLRSKYSRLFFLVDGYDYSTANAKNCSYAFDSVGHGAIVCAGPCVTLAWQEPGCVQQDYLQLAMDEIGRIKKNLAKYVTVL